MTVINTPFLVTGGETNRPPSNAFSPSQRQINIRAPFSLPSAEQWNGQKVWLLIPGFTAPSDSFDATLAKAINDANPNDTVLALDWTQVSGTPTNNATLGIARGDLYRSGSWITPVANAVRDKLVEWGMPAAALLSIFVLVRKKNLEWKQLFFPILLFDIHNNQQQDQGFPYQMANILLACVCLK
jgi:hypothetical protein